MTKMLFAFPACFTLLLAADLSSRKAAVRALIDREDFAAALSQSKSIQKERPDDIESYQMVAAAQLALGDYGAAEKSIQWMLDLRTGKADARGWLLLARFREVTGDLEGALDAVNLAHGRLAAGEESLGPELLAYAGHLHLLAGRLNVAEQAVSELALSGKAPPAAAVETLARIRLKQGRKAEAIALLRMLAARQPLPRVSYFLAETTGDPAGYASIDKASVEYALYLAGPAKRPAEALELARLIAGRRQDVYALDALAVAQFASGDASAAKATLNKVIAVGTRDPRILAHALVLGIARAEP